MRHGRWLALALLAMVVACGPIEQQQVPMWLGLRLNRTVDLATFSQDLAALQQYKAQGLSIELLVEPDSTGLPRLSPMSLQEWARVQPLLLRQPVPLTLVFTHDQFQPLLARWDHRSRQPWFAQYRQQLLGFLHTLPKPLQPYRVVVANRFDRIAHYRQEWDTLLLALRPHTKALLTYAAHLPEADRFHSWQHCDEVAVNYSDVDVDNQKALAQDRNPQLARLAQRYGKPIFIANANLIGDQKLLKLKNRLRFYGETPLSGLTLNNLFPQTVLTDTNAHFLGLQHQPEVLAFLKDYLD